MRKIKLFMVMSADGYISGENGELDWEVPDDSAGEYLIPKLLEEVDAMLLGRVLYQGFQQAWPPIAENTGSPQELRDFAQWIVDTPKTVFSNTIEEADWNNSKIVQAESDDDFRQKVEALKNEPGKDFIVFGGVRFAQTLAKLNLIDEYIFKVQPVVLGKGKSLFSELEQPRKLELLESKAFVSGVLAVKYRPL